MPATSMSPSAHNIPAAVSPVPQHDPLQRQQQSRQQVCHGQIVSLASKQYVSSANIPQHLVLSQQPPCMHAEVTAMPGACPPATLCQIYVAHVHLRPAARLRAQGLGPNPNPPLSNRGPAAADDSGLARSLGPRSGKLPTASREAGPAHPTPGSSALPAHLASLPHVPHLRPALPPQLPAPAPMSMMAASWVSETPMHAADRAQSAVRPVPRPGGLHKSLCRAPRRSATGSTAWLALHLAHWTVVSREQPALRGFLARSWRLFRCCLDAERLLASWGLPALTVVCGPVKPSEDRR